ncbi:AMP-binding protein [Gemmobacter sp. 24YEA27]|uniref:AMP-binding protein n=1 Tax=Gemmobacter sp. 24YEA27 TaxID=3040672 RepID=UPI0024B37AE6|nr:AMP-binding protein [Gemmobacter sp. 24YEA27]
MALIAQRSADAILAMLAVLRAGGAYIPLDPAYASEQVGYILGHAAPGFILHDAASAALVTELAQPGGQVVLEIGVAKAGVANSGAAACDFPQRRGADTAYIIYTSGSTGRPKGVVVPQRALARIAFDQGALTLPPAK